MSHPIYCQVVHPVAFHKDNRIFSPTDAVIEGVGPSPPAGTGAALMAIKLTKHTTAAPESAIPLVLVGGNCISNFTLPTGLEVK